MTPEQTDTLNQVACLLDQIGGITDIMAEYLMHREGNGRSSAAAATHAATILSETAGELLQTIL